MAVLGDRFLDWHGGVAFLNLVLHGLLETGQVGLPIQLLVPASTIRTAMTRAAQSASRRVIELVDGRPRGWRPAEPTPPERVRELFEDVAAHLEIRPYAAGALGIRHATTSVRTDVILPVFRSLGPRFPVPWVGYLYDFQHRHLPELFDPRERTRRDHAFMQMLTCARAVVANAESVRDDADRFFPAHSSHIVALPFAPVPPAADLCVAQGDLRSRYRLPARYFAVCNQFWVHKDHDTAIKALRRLHDTTDQRDVALVCTGKLEDYRAPAHADRLRRLVTELGLESSVLFLGQIPKRDQLAVVQGATAVVQPTRFEGGPGGGAAYDAVALGTPLIVSDIPVNREIDLGAVAFFEVGNDQMLADRMNMALHRTLRLSLSAVRLQCTARLRVLGNRVLEAADVAIAQHRSRSIR